MATDSPPWRHLPNALTAARLLIAGLFPLAGQDWQVVLLVLGLLTEFLDGFLARLLHATSYFGQVLDPVADKLLVLSVSLTWVWQERLTVIEWLVLATRDLGVFTLVLLLFLRGRLWHVQAIQARYLSKVTTALQYLSFFVLLFELRDYLGFSLTALIGLTGVLGLAAALQYAFLLRDELSPGRDVS